MCRLFIRSELERMATCELQALFNRVGGDLFGTAPGTPERRNALASLENIRAELGRRHTLRLR